jgi:hypothetical protein
MLAHVIAELVLKAWARNIYSTRTGTDQSPKGEQTAALFFKSTNAGHCGRAHNSLLKEP